MIVFALHVVIVLVDRTEEMEIYTPLKNLRCDSFKNDKKFIKY